MSPVERKDLSKAEWKVMKIVWELQKAMAREVYTIAGEQYSWQRLTDRRLPRRCPQSLKPPRSPSDYPAGRRRFPHLIRNDG